MVLDGAVEVPIVHDLTTIKQRWIDSHLRKGRVEPRDVGLVIIQMIMRGCLKSLVVVV
jgi:hypothetical protein